MRPHELDWPAGPFCPISPADVEHLPTLPPGEGRQSPRAATGGALDEDVRPALAICGGDAAEALRITLIATPSLKQR